MCNLSKKKPEKGKTTSTRNWCSTFPFAKLGLNVSGPYPTTLSGNKYIICFVDWYSGWSEAFVVLDSSAETVVHLVPDEIIPRHSTPLQIVKDNGTKTSTR